MDYSDMMSYPPPPSYSLSDPINHGPIWLGPAESPTCSCLSHRRDSTSAVMN